MPFIHSPPCYPSNISFIYPLSSVLLSIHCLLIHLPFVIHSPSIFHLLSIHRPIIHLIYSSVVICSHCPSTVFLFICRLLSIHPPFFNLLFHLSICRHLVLLSIHRPLFICHLLSTHRPIIHPTSHLSIRCHLFSLSIRLFYSFAVCYPFTLPFLTCCFTYPFIHVPFISLLSTHCPMIHLPAPIFSLLFHPPCSFILSICPHYPFVIFYPSVIIHSASMLYILRSISSLPIRRPFHQSAIYFIYFLGKGFEVILCVCCIISGTLLMHFHSLSLLNTKSSYSI